MNKMKKLLSVVLAVVLAFSAFSVLGSAAKTAYKTVAELEALDAYSPYGQVTRLSTEERTSIVFDALDSILAQANINPGELFNIVGLKLVVDLRSVDAILGTVDGVQDLTENWLFGIASGLLGQAGSINLDTWPSGMKRDNTAQFTIIKELLELLNANKGLVKDILTDGLDLGLANSALGSLDLSIIEDLPGLVKGLIFPMLERWDDTLTEIKWLDTNGKGNGKVNETVNTFVKNLFNNDMSITTIKYDANGNMTSEHENWKKTATGSAAPTVSDNSPRCYYQFSSTTPGSVMTVYHIVDEKEAETLAKTPDKVNGSPAAYTYFVEKQKFVMTEEVEGSGTYVWQATDDYGNKWSLKWYNDESPFLPGFSGDDFDLLEMSAGDLLYTFIPVVFEQMAPVVLNGSVKKALAEFVGVKFTYVGQVGSDAVNALPDASNAFFTQEQGEYLWEWSDYIVIKDSGDDIGRHYYRFEDQIFAGDLSYKNNYFDIINWDYEVTGDFMNEFVPANDDNANVRLLQNVTKFLNKVGNMVLLPSAETADTRTDYTATWTRPTFAEGNANLVENIKALAQAIVGLAPQHIFGDDWQENPRCYASLMLEDDNDTVLVGIAAHLVDMIMPSMTLPDKDHILGSGAKVGAILAAVVREFAAYLAPEYNFDALIYSDFGTTTADPDKTFVSGKDSEYWLDVILTMGINVGFEYLRAFADMGEGTAEWNSFVSYSGYAVDGKTYSAMTTDELNAHWEGMLDYLIDWALEKDYEWTWKMENLVNTTGLTIDLATAQDPWAKLELALGSILPVSEILTVDTTGTTRDYGTNKMEKFLRHDLILGIVDLRWDELIDTIQFNGTNKYFRTENIVNQLASLLKGIVNSLFAKVGGGSYALIPTSVATFDDLANQSNLASMVEGLLGALYTATGTGLFDTVLPFVNFILGWKTDPQVIADPVIWTQFRDDCDYAYLWSSNGVSSGFNIGDGATLIKVLNNSAGMLEKHRNSSVTDHAYDIQIKSVTSDAKTNTLSFTYGDGNGLVSPYETLDIKVGGTYKGDEAVTVTIAYDYVGKDGKAVGGTQYTSVSFLISNLYEDTRIDGRRSGDNDKDYAGIDQYKKYQFTEDIFTTVTTFEPVIFATKGTTGATGSRNFAGITAPDANAEEKDCDGNVTLPADDGKMKYLAPTYFDFITNQTEAGWESTKPAEGSVNGKLYKAKSGVTAATFENANYGTYDMGSIAVKYGEDSKVWDIVYIYYNDYDIDLLYAENKDNGYNAYQGVDSTTYEAYRTAWNKIVYLATYPMMTEANGNSSIDYVKVIMPQIPAAIEAFETAKEAYETALAEAEATGSADSKLPEYVANLEIALGEDDGDGEKEINFQDYDFYEYFNYADLRTAHRNFIKTYYAPEVMDDYYILNSGIREAELNKVIAAETNTAIATGIEASKVANDPEAVAASKTANAEWKMPVDSKLLVDDMTSRLRYYRSFVNDSVKEDADHLYFLNQEIAHIEAHQLDADDYEPQSWGKFQDAYDYAKEVQAGTADYADYNSTIYNAKWNLMVAYKNLLKNYDEETETGSLIQAGGTAALEANIEAAEAIFAMDYDAIELSDAGLALADDAEEAKEIALGHLIEALGYYYVGEDGNTWNLYAGSAYEYRDNDRPNRQSNQAKVDACNDNLEACVAYFATEEEMEPSTLMVKEDCEYADYVVIDVNNNNYGEYTGIIYGIDTLDQNPDFAPLTDLASALTTNNGDDYLVIEANENGIESTGATITVVDENGDVLETYVFVYFGDIDGDGMITGIDGALASDYEVTYEGLSSYAQYVACDIDGDGMATGIDGALAADFEVTYEGVDYQYNIGQIAVNNMYEWIY